MISVVTINYNNALGLKKTLASLEEQTALGDVQHIIIDGSSTDGSISIAERYVDKNPNVFFLSDEDTGIYNAMNKGLKHATGDFVAFLNSGDTLAGRDCLSRILNKLSDFPETDFLYGDIEIVGDNGSIRRRWLSGNFSKPKIYFGWMPPHPMTTIRKNLLEMHGGFDEKFKIASDYDLMLRILVSKNVKINYVSRCLVLMDAGGISNGSLRNVLLANWEVLRSWYSLKGISLPFWVFLTKPIQKIFQLRP